MSHLIQFAAIVSIAFGAGLFAFSRHLDPPSSVGVPASAMSSQESDTRKVAAIACGFGSTFMTLGTLGLVVPWVNAYVRKQCSNASGTA